MEENGTGYLRKPDVAHERRGMFHTILPIAQQLQNSLPKAAIVT
jgi:hypothetical protein